MSLLQNENGTTMFGHYRVVATVEISWSVYIHSLENGQVGYKKILVELKHHCCL